MNDADRKAFEAWWDASGNGKKWHQRVAWQAACEWRDSQVGEPRYWVHNFGDEDGGEEFFDHPTGSDCPDCVPLYLAPPTAQINQQLVDALIYAKRFLNNKDHDIEYVNAALAATQMRGDA